MIVDWTNPAERVAWLDREIAEIDREIADALRALDYSAIPPEPDAGDLRYIAHLRKWRQRLTDKMPKEEP